MEMQIGLMEVVGICSAQKIDEFRRRVCPSDAVIRASYITYSRERLAYDLSVFRGTQAVLVMDAGSVDGKEFFNILVQSALINARPFVYRAILGSNVRDTTYYRDCVHDAIEDLEDNHKIAIVGVTSDNLRCQLNTIDRNNEGSLQSVYEIPTMQSETSIVYVIWQILVTIWR